MENDTETLDKRIEAFFDRHPKLARMREHNWDRHTWHNAYNSVDQSRKEQGLPPIRNKVSLFADRTGDTLQLLYFGSLTLATHVWEKATDYSKKHPVKATLKALGLAAYIGAFVYASCNPAQDHEDVQTEKIHQE